MAFPSNSRSPDCSDADHQAWYGDRIADPPDIKVIDVMVCKTRKKLALHGIEIRTVWGVGYEIPEESKARARQLMEASKRMGAPPALGTMGSQLRRFRAIGQPRQLDHRN